MPPEAGDRIEGEGKMSRPVRGLVLQPVLFVANMGEEMEMRLSNSPRRLDQVARR